MNFSLPSLFRSPFRSLFRSAQVSRDIRFKLIRWQIIFAVIVVVTVLLFANLARNQLQTDIQNNDIALAQAIAIEIDNPNQNIGETSQNLLSWMKLVWGNQVAVITVVDSNGQNIMQLRGGISLIENSDWSSWSTWQREVIRVSLASQDGSFVSLSPNNEEWLHSFVATPMSDSRVIIQRPTRFAFATLTIIYQIMFVTLAIYLIGVAFFWRSLSHEVISPLQSLEQFSKQVQNSGEVDHNQQRQNKIDGLTKRQDQIGTLASALQEMGHLYAMTDRQLQEKRYQLEATIESLDVGFVLESMDGEVLYSNRQAADWVGQSAAEMTGQPSNQILSTLLEPANLPDDIRQQLISGGQQSFEIERIDAGGERHDLNLERFGVTNASGELIGRGQIWQDVTRYKEVDRLKSALLSTISHELRTPLTSIIGYADTLTATDIEWVPAKRQKFTGRILSEAKRLRTLIENLLDMTKLESGHFEIKRSPAHLHDVLNSTLRSLVQEDYNKLDLHLDQELPICEIDSTRIGTVMRNYVENALKYGPDSGRILITTGRENGTLYFSVTDEGEHISPQNQQRLFEPFYRVENGYTRSAGGIGLGLSICKGFIDAHGGQVWVDSNQTGNTFGFSIPLNDTHPHKHD